MPSPIIQTHKWTHINLLVFDESSKHNQSAILSQTTTSIVKIPVLHNDFTKLLYLSVLFASAFAYRVRCYSEQGCNGDEGPWQEIGRTCGTGGCICCSAYVDNAGRQSCYVDVSNAGGQPYMAPCSVLSSPSDSACDTDNCGQLQDGNTCYDLPHPFGEYAEFTRFSSGTTSVRSPVTIPGSG